MPHSIVWKCLLTSLVLLCFLPPDIEAALIEQSYDLDQTNSSPFTDGTTFGTVTIGIDGNTVYFTVDVSDLLGLTGVTAGSNFGLQTFGFNTNLALTPGMFTLPSDWDVAEKKGALDPKNQDGFGKFDVVSSGDGSSRQSPLEFTIDVTGLGAVSFANFELFSEGDAKDQGNQYFAGHVAGFEVKGSGTTSMYIAGSSLAQESPPEEQIAPEPCSAILLGLGGIGLAGFVRFSRRGRIDRTEI